MTDIHPIKSVIQTPTFTKEQVIVLFVLIGLVILGIAIWFIIKYWKKYKLSKMIEIPEPVVEIDYKTIALEKLTSLKTYIDKDDYKHFYLMTTEIVKEYVDGVFKVKTKDLTTAEVIYLNQLSDDIKNDLKKLFQTIDLAKFADRNLDSEEAIKVYKMSINLINKNI